MAYTKPTAPRITITIAATQDYKSWLTRVAHSIRLDASTFVDQALAAYAQTQGLEAPPARKQESNTTS